MQGSFRPPDDTKRRPRRSDLLFQMSRNGMIVHADNSDLSYKAILTRLAWDASGGARSGGSSGEAPGARGTYGLALEALSEAPVGEARRVLVAAAIVRTLQDLALAHGLLLAAARRPAPGRPPGGARGVAPALAAGFAARALTGARAAFDFVRPLLRHDEGAPVGVAPGGAPGEGVRG